MRRLLVLCAALLAAAPAQAPVFTVTVNSTADAVDADPGDGVCADANFRCTLRAAVTEVNLLYRHQDIELLPGRYVLTLGSLVVDDGDSQSDEALRLHGRGAATTIIDAAGSDRVITAHDSLELRGVTITGGVSPGYGGGVLSSTYLGSLTIRDSVIAGNSAQLGAGILFGGGAWLLLDRVTVSHNQGDESALFISQSTETSPFGAFAIVNSTISNNTTEHGATIFGLSGNGVIANSTVADNRRGSEGSEVFAIVGLGFPGQLSASIVANPELDGNCDFSDRVVSGGYNIDSDGSCNLTDPTDLPNTDPLLGRLGNHGGPTETHALLPGSPAIDAIPVADCTYDDDGDSGTPEWPLATDQRGVRRPQGAGCDIGAFEVPEPSGALMAVTSTIVLVAMRRLQGRREGERGAAGQGRSTCSSPSEWTSPRRQTFRGMRCRTRRGGTTGGASGRGMRRRRQSWCRT